MGQPVTVAVGVLTFNRFDLLKRTIESLERTEQAFWRVLVDGGSSDPAQRRYVEEHHGECLQIPTVGESMNIVIERCLRRKPNIVVFSADDYEYKPGWLARLLAFWYAAPLEIVLASLNWEPDYPWNVVEDVYRIGGEMALLRTTIPGSSWSFRARDWPLIGPITAKTGGEDLEVCQRLRANGYQLAALNLTEHIGEQHSAWGNRSWTIAKPLRIAETINDAAEIT